MKHMDRMELSELLEQFIQAARGYEDGLENASAKEANRNMSIGERVVEELARRDAEQDLLGLIEHQSPIVRAWAAAYGLDFAPDIAVPVLEGIMQEFRGMPATFARIELSRWRNRKTHA